MQLNGIDVLQVTLYRLFPNCVVPHKQFKSLKGLSTSRISGDDHLRVSKLVIPQGGGCTPPREFSR